MTELTVVKNNLPTRTEIIAAIEPAKGSEVLEIVAVLIDGFPTRKTDDQGMENLAKAYVMAVDEWPLDAITAAATAFIKGKVENASTTFLPTCADFAKETRLQFWKIQHAARTQD